MQWSPVKLAGNKRALEEACEAEESPTESEEDREEGEISSDEEEPEASNQDGARIPAEDRRTHMADEETTSAALPRQTVACQARQVSDEPHLKETQAPDEGAVSAAAEGDNGNGDGGREVGVSSGGGGRTQNVKDLDEKVNMQEGGKIAQPGHAAISSDMEQTGALAATEASISPARHPPSKSTQSPATGTGDQGILEPEHRETSREGGRGLPGTFLELGSDAEVVSTEFPAPRVVAEGHRQGRVGDRTDLPLVESEETARVRWCNGPVAPGAGRADTLTEQGSRYEDSSRIGREKGKFPKEKPWDFGPTHRQCSQAFMQAREVEGIVVSSFQGREFSHHQTVSSSEIIKETQLSSQNRDKGRMFNEILASIGLDSPTTSQVMRTEEGYPRSEYGHDPHLVCTPTSLTTLGKQVVTPRQGRSWTYQCKSPLGG